MKVLEIAQEFIPQNRDLAGRLARQMISGAQERLYQSGKGKPSVEEIQKTVDIMAKRFYNDLLKAADQELGAGAPKGTFSASA